MLLSKRRSIQLLLAGFGLAACGFAPAYAPGGAAVGFLDRVTVDTPVDKNSFDLVERLEERLGRPTAPAFRLSYSVSTNVEGQAITTANAINRYQISGSTSFALHDLTSGTTLTEGSVSALTAYSASGTPVATVMSESDAYARLMRIMADQVVTRLIATSGEWNR
jgi:LPS-assembly lipoprotein